MFESEIGPKIGATTTLLGLSLLYLGTRFALLAWASVKPGAVGRRAVAQWLPVAAAVIALAALGNPLMAVELTLGTSVACLSLVLGLALMSGALYDVPSSRRVWPLVLPPALLVLLIGFRGSFLWYHAIMLLAMGGALAAMWWEPAVTDGPPMATPIGQRSTSWLRGLFAILLAILGGVLTAQGSIHVANYSRLFTGALMSSSVVSPLVLLPVIGSTTTMAHRGQLGQVVSSVCGMVQLNLCILLPVVILIGALHPIFSAHVEVSSTLATAGSVLGSTPFPVMTWRIDSVVLVVLAFALVPVAAGRWLPERYESILLVGVYFAYLAAQASLAVRLLS